MSRKLQHVSLNLKDKEMIKRIFILMQLKNIPSPGTSKQGRGWLNESGIKQTWVDCVKKRSGESDALLRLALKMWTFPSPSSLPPTIPQSLPYSQMSNLWNCILSLGRGLTWGELKGCRWKVYPSQSQTAMNSGLTSARTDAGCHSDHHSSFWTCVVFCTRENHVFFINQVSASFLP